MKKMIAVLLAVLLLLGNSGMAYCAELASLTKEEPEKTRYSYRTKTLTQYDTANAVESIRVRLTVPNYMGTIHTELNTTEGSGPADILVVYLQDSKWDNGCYYSAVSGSVFSETAKIYAGGDKLIQWKDIYKYGFLPLEGGIYTADFNSLQMHFLNGPGLYTAMGALYYSDMDFGARSLEEAAQLAPYAIKLTAAGYPFVLALDDATIDYFRRNGTLDRYSSFGWSGLQELLDASRYELPSVKAETALANFVNKRSFFTGIFLDVQVKGSRWYDSSIASAYSLGLIEGSRGSFYPERPVTLAETIAMACRLHNIYNGGSGEFTEGPVWYSVYVSYALKNGIIRKGDFDSLRLGMSAYDRSATRAEFAYIIGSCLPYDALPRLNRISDIPDVTRYRKYSAQIYRLYESGILDGREDHAFEPETTITRAEAAAAVNRMAHKELRLEFTL